MKRNDTTPAFECTLYYPASTAVNLTTAASVRFLMTDAATGTLKVNRLATIVTPAAGTVRHTWQVGDTDTAGMYNIEWEVLWGDGTKQTFPDTQYLRLAIEPDLGP
jgi:hypothetical protein